MKYMQVTQLMESIYGKEKNDSFKRRMEENNVTPPNKVPKTAPIARSSNFNVKMQPGLQIPQEPEGCHEKCFSDGRNDDGITESKRKPD
ncbi:hypothetical protein O181_076045 [Austropuccinia psidii MF-1]|uniref:Uncharacterized protein n=1 Tax=Austropuccinia psidii MF-1 TaxID=1389203 RepID=A0A9Q3FFH2_9BASI|nr:hypothetical protein [Austropuccinia psidii MF-1]